MGIQPHNIDPLVQAIAVLIYNVLFRSNEILSNKEQAYVNEIAKKYKKLSLSSSFDKAAQSSKIDFIKKAVEPLAILVKDADREAGEAIRMRKHEVKRLRLRDAWIDSQKTRLGYGPSVSFDVVFEDLIKKSGVES